MTMMRAKFYIASVERFQSSELLTMSPVVAKAYGADGLDENNTYAKYTPTGTLTLMVANPALIGKFDPGDVFYLDFTPAE